MGCLLFVIQSDMSGCECYCHALHCYPEDQVNLMTKYALQAGSAYWLYCLILIGFLCHFVVTIQAYFKKRGRQNLDNFESKFTKGAGQ